jgi:bacteriorhodopsin
MVLDVSAKVGFGFILLRSRGVLEQTGAAATERTATPTD